MKDSATWTVAGMIACGIELMWVKSNLKHGDWGDWVNGKLGWSFSTTSRLMNMARLYAKQNNLRIEHKQVLAAQRQRIYSLYSNLALTQSLPTNHLDPWGNKPRQLTTSDNWLRVYDVWNFAFRDPNLGEEWPGNIPGQIAMNVIHYYTKEGDLVIDPMAGGGSTIDACKKLNRRCVAYDINPLKEKGIKYNDITKGFPNECENCDLIFLDPPYYKINRPLYGEQSVSALEIDEFNLFVIQLAKDCYKTVKVGGYTTFLMQNYYTEFASLNGHIDLTVGAIVFFAGAGFKLASRINCPQSSDVYSGWDIELAKQNGVMLNLVRDLLIFKKLTPRRKGGSQ